MEMDGQVMSLLTALSSGYGFAVRVEYKAGSVLELVFCPCWKSVHDSSVIEAVAKTYRVHCPGFVVSYYF